MNEYAEMNRPIVLFAKLEYLRRLQSGQMYMPNSLYYNQLEAFDSHRGDRYDSAVKSIMFNRYIPDSIVNETSNHRITLLSSYIKCFFQYRREDMQFYDDRVVLSISEQAKNKMKLFDCKDALLIFDVPKFLGRFSNACSSLGYDHSFGPVEYVNEEDYKLLEKELIEAAIEKRNCSFNPIFVKRMLYQHQQEFRLSVRKSFPHDVDYICREYENSIEPLSFQMDAIEDISIVVKAEDLIEDCMALCPVM